MFANVGDTIFAKGQTKRRKVLIMSNSICSIMPGAYQLPFEFSIESCNLVQSFETKHHVYYAAPYSKCDARHSMLGKVLSRGILLVLGLINLQVKHNGILTTVYTMAWMLSGTET